MQQDTREYTDQSNEYPEPVPVEPAESWEPGGQVEPAEAREPGGQVEPAQAREPDGQVEPAQAREPDGQVEPADAREPDGQVEPVEPVEPITATATATAPAPATDSSGRLWPEETVQDLRERWRDVLLRFVDDPPAAADQAETLVKEVLDGFSAAVATHKGELDGWRGGDRADTEQMRMAVRRYQELFDRLLAV